MKIIYSPQFIIIGLRTLLREYLVISVSEIGNGYLLDIAVREYWN
jgi:hypothetical protein